MLELASNGYWWPHMLLWTPWLLPGNQSLETIICYKTLPTSANGPQFLLFRVLSILTLVLGPALSLESHHTVVSLSMALIILPISPVFPIIYPSSHLNPHLRPFSLSCIFQKESILLVKVGPLMRCQETELVSIRNLYKHGPGITNYLPWNFVT